MRSVNVCDRRESDAVSKHRESDAISKSLCAHTVNVCVSQGE